MSETMTAEQERDLLARQQSEPMWHWWGYPDDDERELVEAMEKAHGHRELWCGAWHCIRCKTVFCEHCSLEAAEVEGCSGASPGGWKVRTG